MSLLLTIVDANVLVGAFTDAWFRRAVPASRARKNIFFGSERIFLSLGRIRLCLLAIRGMRGTCTHPATVDRSAAAQLLPGGDGDCRRM
jgi:hypothetical protein